MKKTIEDCPKAYEAYKKWLIDGLKEKYPEQEMFATDNLIELSITTSPLACTYYFDTIDMVGTLDYSTVDKEFIPCVNAQVIDVHEDHQHYKNRKEAEESLIKYLFIELEKTL